MTPPAQQPVVIPFGSATGLPVEVVPLDRIRRKAGARGLAGVQRLDFTMFLLYHQGIGVHVVDFELLPVQPGTLIAIPFGRSHQFRLTEGMDGTAIVVAADFIQPPALDDPGQSLRKMACPAASILSPEARTEFAETCAALARDTSRFAGNPLLPDLLRTRLQALLVVLQMDWLSADPRSDAEAGPVALVRAFRREVEDHALDRWTVADYARRLGYAERTLTRACLTVDGRSAKSIVDDRLALEIRRWLANSSETIEAIAFRLGFAEPSNLTQFFRRVTGRTPSEFRAQWSGAAG